jgi:hypothetical protein
MSDDWIEVTKKTNKKKNLTSGSIETHVNHVEIKSPEKITEKDINIIFEDNYAGYLENSMQEIIDNIKPHSLLLQNVYQNDLTDFFYDYFDKGASIKVTKEEKVDKFDYCSDDEYF